MILIQIVLIYTTVLITTLLHGYRISLIVNKTKICFDNEQLFVWTHNMMYILNIGIR